MAKYTVLKNKDSFHGDYSYHPGKSIDDLKRICDYSLDCIGFNSLGYTKKELADKETLINLDGTDLYIRTDRIQKIIERKKGFLSGKGTLDITFVITTCKRLDLFCETIDKLLFYCQDLYLIRKWICIDDNSSEKDRKEMRKRYPFFHFIMKTPEQKGHARSLNIILELVKTKYVFFFEDDWRCNMNFSIAPYVDFLETFNRDQIIFHGRSEKDGYPKLAMLHNKDIYGYCYNPTHPAKKETKLQYYYERFEKEFQVKGEKVGFFYPGFSLNPSIFNMDKIRSNNLQFREEPEYHDCFELYFAFQCLQKGFQTSFSNILICHIGEISAYVLNKDPRCFDPQIKNI